MPQLCYAFFWPQGRIFMPEARPIKLTLPLFLSPVRAGFPSPAEDFVDKNLDLNEFLIPRPAATFLLRVEGDSMKGAGIFSGDILVCDRSLTPRTGQVVVAVIDGEFTVKRFKRQKGEVWLMAENPDYPPIYVTGDTSFEIFGVVTCVLHAL